MRWYDLALEKSRALKDKNGEATTLNNIGLLYAATGQPQKALKYYEKALPIRGEIGDRYGEETTLNNIGSLYSNIGQFQKALEYYEMTLPIEREIGDRSGEATTLNNVGSLYSDLGQPQKALEYYEMTLPIRREVGDRSGEATTLNNIGTLYSNTGQPQKALEDFEKALIIERAVGNKSGEATTLSNIGLAYFITGRPQKALEDFEKALIIERAVGDKNGEAETLNNVGSLYSGIGQPQKALEYFQKALPLKRVVGDRSGEASTLNNIGLLYSNTGQPQKALEDFEKALIIERAVGNKSGEATTLNNVGTLYSDLGQFQKALKYYEKALPIEREVGDESGEATTLSNIGLASSELGQPQKALEYYEKALPIRREVGDRSGEATTLNNIGIEKEHQGLLAEAEASYRQAIALVETYRENIGTLSEAKVSFLQEKLPIYHRYLHLLLERQKTILAFEVAQQTKARALLDLMAGGKVNLTGRLTAEEQAREQELRAQTDRLHNAMLAEAVQNQVGSKQRFARLKVELGQAESALQTYRNTLYSLHPELQRKRIARTVSLAEVGKFLPADTAILEYVTLRAGRGKNVIDQTVLFVVTWQQGQLLVQSYPIEKTYRQLQEKAGEFRATCSEAGGAYGPQAQALGRLLLPASALQQIATQKRLIVCPGGPLWGVPFQALFTPNGRFLIQEYELAYAYSATGAEAALKAKEEQRAKPTGTLLAFANPDFGGATRFAGKPPVTLLRPLTAPSRPIAAPSRPIAAPSRPLAAPSRPIAAPSRPIAAPSRPIAAPSRDVLTQRGGITPLPGTQKEAEALKADFPGPAPQVVVLTGKEAQKSRALQEMGKYRYLHFATHGWLNDGVPLLSSILLAQPALQNKQEGDEGFLTAREIFDLDLSADLVVLSACNTAQGGNQNGEGIVGLTWALFVAGAPTQVVSQWSVNDESTAVLMQAFYANLTRGKMAKGKALREAMLSLLKAPQYTHPHYWAPFILMGDWR